MVIGCVVSLVGHELHLTSQVIRKRATTGLATVLHQINWVLHLLLVAGVVMWIDVQGIVWWQYIVLCGWPGLSLTLMRSYAEHRPGDNNHRR